MIFNILFRLRRQVFAAILMSLCALSVDGVQAAELVMFESEGCDWCEAWDDDIGVAYDKTSEAKVVPLRRVDIDDDRPADLSHLEGLMYTPTFVVMKDGNEVGRIIGYPGEDFFWQLLNEIIEKI
jgi:thioredoxin-related protein